MWLITPIVKKHCIPEKVLKRKQGMPVSYQGCGDAGTWRNGAPPTTLALL
jgi:hypothetical protein